MKSSDPTQTCVSLDSPREWKRALRGIPHAFTHTWEYCYAMHLTTGYPTFLYCFEADSTRIVCPITERPCGGHIEAVTPLGVSGFCGTGDFAGFPSWWEEFARFRGYVTTYIALNPLFDHPSFTDPTLTQQHNSLFFLDLTVKEEELFRGFSESRRRGLRRWEESAVSIVTDRDALTLFILNNYRGFFRQKGFPLAYNFDESTVAFLLALNQIYIIGAAIEGGLQSVLACCYTQDVADALFSIALPEGRHHGVGLLWHAARHFQQLGVPMFNLGGGISVDDSVAESKRRFGARRLPLRSLRQVIRPEVYDQLCAHAGVCATDRTGYFPPYQRPLAAR